MFVVIWEQAKLAQGFATVVSCHNASLHHPEGVHSCWVVQKVGREGRVTLWMGKADWAQEGVGLAMAQVARYVLLRFVPVNYLML